MRHPGVFKRVAEHLVGSDEDAANGKKGRGMSGFSPQGLGNLAWSYAKQAQLGADVNGSKVGSTGRLAVYETSCLDIGESLIQRLFAGIAEGAMSGKYGIIYCTVILVISIKVFVKDVYLLTLSSTAQNSRSSSIQAARFE